MNRREFMEMVVAGTASVLSEGGASAAATGGAEVRAAPPAAGGRTPWPREVAGVRSVDSDLAALAVRTLTGTSPDFLVNHAARTFYFGALIGRARKKTFDPELLFLGCVLHDLGLTEAHMGPLPFEVQGAEAARNILQPAGLPPEKVEVVWDAIAMHPFKMAEFKRPEIALVAAGAEADVVGTALDLLGKEQVAGILAAFPRLDFKRRFVGRCAGVVERYPRGATRSFMRDVGEREVASFKPRNICDSIQAAPFQE
jgi:hypothetical protein